MKILKIRNLYQNLEIKNIEIKIKILKYRND